MVDVCVVGSCNMDLVTYVPRMPLVGETIHGHSFVTGFGGKGNNQAAMAAKLDANVAMIGKVGNDGYGREMIENFNKLGVNISSLLIEQNVSTGVAPILVTDEGQNSIVVVPGANCRITLSEINSPSTVSLIQSCKVLVSQNEITPEVTLEAMKIAKASSSHPIVFYNPAPAVANLGDEILRVADIVCLNETEAETLTGVAITNEKDGENACNVLLTKGARHVILTMGSKGVFYRGYLAEFEAKRNNKEIDSSCNEPSSYFCPVQTVVTVVDTSGAGDSFVGALSYYLARHVNVSLTEAIRRASIIASDSVTRKGTQSSYPTKAMLDQSLFN